MSKKWSCTLFLFVVLVIAAPFSAQAICRPQCTDYINQKLGLNHHVGSAVSWWKNPPSGYKRHKNGSDEKPTKNDILVWQNVGGGNGHVAIVQNVDKDQKKITIKDSNWATNWQTDCKERTRTLKYRKDGKRYIIEASNILGWLSK